jgi:hypothetical protein
MRCSIASSFFTTSSPGAPDGAAAGVDAGDIGEGEVDDGDVDEGDVDEGDVGGRGVGITPSCANADPPMAVASKSAASLARCSCSADASRPRVTSFARRSRASPPSPDRAIGNSPRSLRSLKPPISPSPRVIPASAASQRDRPPASTS